MEASIRQIDLNGHTFEYLEWGNPSGAPLVALHALGKTADSWDGVAAALGKDYRILALNQRGHAGSPRMDTYSFELMCEDLHKFVDALNLEKFTLLGHSMGGTVSYLFSEKFPTRIERLIVEDTPPPFPDTPIEIPSKPPGDLPFDWLALTSILKQLNEPDPEWWTCLKDISKPTLILGGGASHIPQNKLKEVAELIPDCEMVTIEDAGHFVHEEKLTDFLDAIQLFLYS